MKKKQKPQFFALYKNFNTGKIEAYDVLYIVFNRILTQRGSINKKKFYFFDKSKDWEKVPIKTKEQLQILVRDELMYHFWGKCEWEFVTIDWPYRDTIENSRPVKIDVYDQLESNIPVITGLVWDYIEPKVKKLIEKENE